MKIIKFRGKDIQTGKFIYGDLIHSHSEKGGVLISEERPISTPARRVEDDSVAQFVGYDADGKEIYEGDICVDKYWRADEKAVLTSNFAYINGNDTPQHFSCYRLKGK